MLPLGHSYNGNHLEYWPDKLPFGNLGKANSLGNSQAHSIVHLDYTSFNNLLAFLFINIGCCVFQ